MSLFAPTFAQTAEVIELFPGEEDGVGLLIELRSALCDLRHQDRVELRAWIASRLPANNPFFEGNYTIRVD